MFILIWSRWGIVVPVLALVGVFVGNAVASSMGVHYSYGPQLDAFAGIGLVIAAALQSMFNTFVVGTYVDKPRPTTVEEQAAGAGPVGSPVSTFFFVPLKYWPAVLGALGVIVFAVNLVGFSPSL